MSTGVIGFIIVVAIFSIAALLSFLNSKKKDLPKEKDSKEFSEKVKKTQGRLAEQEFAEKVFEQSQKERSKK